MLTLIVKALGFLREVIVGYFGGTSAITDAYNISNTIPNFFFVVITQIIAIAFIPIFLSIKTNSGEQESNKFANKCLVLILIITSIFSILMALFPDFLTSIFASGMDAKTKEMSSQLLRICCWSVIFQSFTIIFSSFLNAKKYFIPPILCGLILDVVTVVLFFVYSKSGNIIWIGLIQLLSCLLQAIMLGICAHKAGFRIILDKNLFDKNIKKVLIVSIPALISVGVYEINVLVDKNFGSYFGTGSISSLSYAQTVNNLFYTLIVNSIIVVAYTSFSEMAAKNEKKEATRLLANSIKRILLITIPLVFVVVLYSKDIITVLFMRGKFDAYSVDLTYKNLICYVIGLPFLSLSFLAVRFLYANRDYYVAILISTIGLLANIGFNFVSYYLTNFGPAGIAMATSISSLLQTILIYAYIKKKYGISILNESGPLILSSLITSILLIPVVFAVNRLFFNVKIIYITLPLEIIIVLCFYLLISFLSEAEALKEFKKFLLRKKEKK